MFPPNWENANTDVTEIFDGTIRDDPFRWPLLWLGLQEQRMAHSTKFEWLIDKECPTCHQGHVRDSEYNYTQIFRSRPYSATDKHREMCEKWLDDIETALRLGRRERSFEGAPYSLLSGVPELLGRWPRKTDVVSLVFLLRPTLRVDDLRHYPVYEWLTELTVMAVRKDVPSGSVKV